VYILFIQKEFVVWILGSFGVINVNTIFGESDLNSLMQLFITYPVSKIITTNMQSPPHDQDNKLTHHVVT
jgi:hypothetical protein